MLLSTVTMLALASPPAELSADRAEMIAEARTYFQAEKRGTAGFMFVGASSLVGSAFLAFGTSDDTAHGAAIPISVIGLAQMLVGGIVFFRTDRQLAKLEEQIRTDPNGYVTEELPRIERVNAMFGIYQLVELGLIAVGGGLAAYGTAADTPWVEGVGYGLALQALVVFIGDTLAHQRAGRYESAIRDLSVTLGRARDSSGRPVETLGLALRF